MHIAGFLFVSTLSQPGSALDLNDYSDNLPELGLTTAVRSARALRRLGAKCG
jgi:hypothetical protein